MTIRSRLSPCWPPIYPIIKALALLVADDESSISETGIVLLLSNLRNMSRPRLLVLLFMSVEEAILCFDLLVAQSISVRKLYSATLFYHNHLN